MHQKGQMWAIGGMRVVAGFAEFLEAIGVAAKETPRKRETDG